MKDPANALALALLATLEAKAKRKGQKSLAKQVAQRLRQSSADTALIGQVEALSAKPKTPDTGKPAVSKPAAGKNGSKASAKAKPRAVVAEA